MPVGFFPCVPPHSFHSVDEEERMKRNMNALRGFICLLLIFSFLTSCDNKPKAPDLSKEANGVVYKPPTKGLGTPGWLGTLPWIHDLIERIRIRFFPCFDLLLGSSECNPGLKTSEETRVKMPGFYMFEGPVTNGQYAACEESGVCTPPQTSDQGPCSQYRNSKFADKPVVCVNWFQANMFCQWAEGKIPSEAQWEAGACGSNGSVREWVGDWFESTPLKIGLFNPTGPTEGKLKRVVGGGQPDSGFEPDTTHTDVGFRCVPTPPEYAPFCPSTFTRLCADPNTPTNEQPCTPGLTENGGKTTVDNFGCPADGQVSITFNSNGGGNSGFSAVVNGQNFTCNPTNRPDVFSCSGPEQRMGSTVEITVCGGGQATPTPSPNTQATTGGSIRTNLLFGNDLLNVRKTIVHYCPEGYIWQEAPATASTPASGQCVRDPNMDCPKGWYLSALMDCQPKDESSCPPGTKWNPNLGGCVPEKDCPEGFVLTEKKTCEPQQNDRKLCPAGYYFNQAAQCCQPIRGNNYNCDNNHYWDPNYKRCLPIDGNGCGFNFVYDCYGRCIRKPYEDPQQPGEGQCPGNLTFAAGNICNTPSNGYNNEKPDPLRMLLPGDTRTPDGLVSLGGGPAPVACSPGSDYIATFNNCINRDGNNCPFGYHFSENHKKCIPDYGPGSGCPMGTRFQSQLGCCAPIPGFDGARCPQDPTSAAAANININEPQQVFGLTVYNPLQGVCDPGTAGQGQTPQCPPGYAAAAVNQPCSLNENVFGNLPDCKSYEYFDLRLGYCVPLQPDCCPLGESFSTLLKRCAPDMGNPPRDGKVCENGYELVDGQCRLRGRDQGSQCITLKVNVPTCFGPCKVGYTMVNGQCVKTDPCADVNCLVCRTYKNCPPGCCK